MVTKATHGVRRTIGLLTMYEVDDRIGSLATFLRSLGRDDLALFSIVEEGYLHATEQTQQQLTSSSSLLIRALQSKNSDESLHAHDLIKAINYDFNASPVSDVDLSKAKTMHSYFVSVARLFAQGLHFLNTSQYELACEAFRIAMIKDAFLPDKLKFEQQIAAFFACALNETFDNAVRRICYYTNEFEMGVYLVKLVIDLLNYITVPITQNWIKSEVIDRFKKDTTSFTSNWINSM